MKDVQKFIKLISTYNTFTCYFDNTSINIHQIILNNYIVGLLIKTPMTLVTFYNIASNKVNFEI